MKYVVNVSIRDWPKRSDFMRRTLTVEAGSVDDALKAAPIEGQTQWPGGKIIAYDAKLLPEPIRPILSAKQKVA